MCADYLVFFTESVQIMLSNFSFDDSNLSALNVLRQEVRDFLEEERQRGTVLRSPEGWDRFDPAFSKRLGARGWLGMTLPKEYGGHERTALERYVVTEELITAGAPLRAHWLTDRQIGPGILHYGTEAQKRLYLPRIAAGELYFCAGLSEPDSGSDLASIRTRATRVDGGWRINGSKIWTSGAHRVHMINLFARSSGTPEDRQQGVTQFLTDLNSPGITVRPIINMHGDHDFNQVFFDDVFVPDDAVLGTVGNAWSQVSTELAHERSGCERWLLSYGLLTRLITQVGSTPEPHVAERIGHLVAHLWTMHRMSFSIAAMLEEGKTPNVEAALVKDLGTHYDLEVPVVARQLIPPHVRASLEEDAPFNAMFNRVLDYSPSFTIRGGTREILRGIIARGLGLR